jgi:hypothetical protein
MGLFGIGNLLLKFKRKTPRPEKAKGISVVFAVSLIVAAFYRECSVKRGFFYFYKIPLLAIYIMLDEVQRNAQRHRTTFLSR